MTRSTANAVKRTSGLVPIEQSDMHTSGNHSGGSPPTAINRPLAILLILLLAGWLLRSSGTCQPVGLERSVHPGINKEYKNPDIPRWMGRFESESREIYEHRRRIVADVLRIPPSSSLFEAEFAPVTREIALADVGAGTGFLTVLFGKALGPQGRVYAVDIVPEFLELIRRRAEDESLNNVSTVLCTERDVSLPQESVDIVFVCDTYHHFEYPRSTLESIFRALRSGGELVIIDFQRIEGVSRAWILEHVRCDQQTVIDEVLAAGFEVDEAPDADYLEENYFLRFRKP